LTLFIRQIPNITDPFVGRLFSGGSQSSSEFIVQDFAVIMIVAAIMLIITYKLKQSMVIGYILAGIVIGPYTPPFSLIHNIDTVNVFAELGIIMLLFVIGTEFPIAKFRSVGRISIIVALLDLIFRCPGFTIFILRFYVPWIGYVYYKYSSNG